MDDPDTYREPKPAPRDISTATMPGRDAIEALMRDLRPEAPTQVEQDDAMRNFMARLHLSRNAADSLAVLECVADLPRGVR